MKDYKKYAPVGLIIGFLGAIASLVFRFIYGQFTLPVLISIGVSIIGLVGFVVLDPDSILAFFKGRQAKYGSNSLILFIAVLGILVLVNLFIYNNNQTWDLTEDKSNSLAEETIAILQKLESPVYAKAFYSSQANSETAETLLRNVKNASDGLFDYEFIDPLTDPVAATQAGIDRDATIVLEVGEQREKITVLSEQNLINGIIKMQNPEQMVLYALTGHGELDAVEPGDFSMTEVRTLMESKNYRLETLNLIAVPEIPDDAKAIIIAGPQVPIDENEKDLIAEFLDNGGSLIVFYAPPFLTQFGDREDPLANYLSENWGITLGDDMIIDLSIDPPEIAIAEQYIDHPITEAVAGFITFFPTTRSVQTTQIATIGATNLVLTSNRAWAETNIEGILNNEASFDETDDIQGPITLAAALQDNATGARVVIVGDSDFISDPYVTSYGNLDFSIGIIDWVAANEDIITISPRESTTRILVPPTKATRLGIILGGLIGLPLFIAITGIVIAVQRKRTE
jgi:ABC-type uncharacterized transport system involved in gliding motility auxiliary subunit